MDQSTTRLCLDLLTPHEAIGIIGEDRANADPRAHRSVRGCRWRLRPADRRPRALLEELSEVHLIEPIACERFRFHDLLRTYVAERAGRE